MTDPKEWLEGLVGAVNAHDLEGVVARFADDYVNQTPAHTGRGFTGSGQVRRTWGRIFAAVPDLEAEVLRHAVDGDCVWSEWETRGTRPDGTSHLMRGVIVFGVVADRARWARLYLEPVDSGEGGVDAAVGRIVGEERP